MRNKHIRAVIILFMVLCIATPTVWANQISTSYTYSFWGEVNEAPEAYLPSNTITGDSLGCGPFKEPRSLFVKEDEIYIVDSGNNRIVICNADWELVSVIDQLDGDIENNALSMPHDVFVTDEGEIYIADTGNQRIVKTNKSGELLQVITKPESELIPENFLFEPLKLVVDNAGRIYVVAKNINQGIMELDPQGGFTSYVGANKVVPDLADLMWKKIATDAQKERMELFVPIEFNNIFIDPKGFLYVTTDVIDPIDLVVAIQERDDTDRTAPVKKLNSMGLDILRRNGHFPPVGDLQFTDEGTVQGPSQIIDVVVDDSDIYSVLDKKRGRIFTYDFEGNLLYIFGENGNTEGAFKSPIALEKVGDKFIVLDFGLNRILEFEPTAYATKINEALYAYKEGYYDESADLWRQVLSMNANYDLAYSGMGRAAYRNGDFEDALHYFELGNNHKGYSKAYKFYRKEVIEENFTWIMLGVLGVAGTIITIKYKKRKRGDTHEEY